MAATIRDVARHCGLSPSAVSGILNNRAYTWASEETRRRVREAAEAMGYQPHHAARSLRMGKTLVVTFLFHQEYLGPGGTLDGTAEIIAARLGTQGYELRLHIYPNQKELMRGLSDVALRQSSDAVLLFGRERDTAEQGVFLERHNIPFVVKGRHEALYPHWNQVDYDHEGMMRQVVERFAALGHRRIAYIGGAHGEVHQQKLFQGFHDAYRERFEREPDARFLLTAVPDAVPARVAQWFASSGDEQPTAIAIATADADWHCIERELAFQGRIIAEESPDSPTRAVAVAGQSYGNLHLAYGQGDTFTSASLAFLGEIAVDQLLLPLLRGEKPLQSVQRILPELASTKSLHLPPPSP